MMIRLTVVEKRTDNAEYPSIFSRPVWFIHSVFKDFVAPQMSKVFPQAVIAQNLIKSIASSFRKTRRREPLRRSCPFPRAS